MFGSAAEASASLLDDDSRDEAASSPASSIWRRTRQQRADEEKRGQDDHHTAAASTPSYQPPQPHSTSSSSSAATFPLSSPLPPAFVPSDSFSPPVQPPASGRRRSSQSGIAAGAPLMAADPLDEVRVVSRPPSRPGLSSPRAEVWSWLQWHCRAFFTALFAHFSYYLQHSRQELQKRKFNYCLGSLSCFLVVTVAAVCYTLIARAPVVFLQQAESQQGQFDARLDLDTGVSGAAYINFTQLSINLAVRPQLGYHSPRHAFNMRVFGSDCTTRVLASGLNLSDPNWRYIGSAGIMPPGTPCNNRSTDCISWLCPAPISRRDDSVTLYLTDTERERAMGLGRLWELPTLAPDEAVISSGIAVSKGLKVGDLFLISGQPMQLLSSQLVDDGMNGMHGVGFFDRNVTSLVWRLVREYGYRVTLLLRVKAIVSDWRGKLGAGVDDAVMMEFGSFLSFVLPQMHPNLRLTSIAMLRSVVMHSSDDSYRLSSLPHSPLAYMQYGPPSLYAYTGYVLLSLPPSRISPYMQTNYDDIQDLLVGWASAVMYFASFPQLNISMPILGSLFTFRFFSLFLGLILSVILTILFILSTMLIYSLLMISIETRTFELGVHRMVGMRTAGIVQMLLVQACSYSVPAWVLGLMTSQLIAALICAKLESTVEVPVDRLLTPYSVLVSTFLGLVIPLLAAILPIRTALGKNLHDSLDTAHSKTQGVQFSIERSEDSGLNSAWLAVGSGFVVFGFLIYYLLPLSLLSFNLSLFFDLFFGLLLGLLFGLILLALNCQQLLERLLLRLFFFWERPQIPFIVSKNLIAHRGRNRKTSIMFALSLGFIIFITVAYEMEITSAKFRELQQNGQSVTVASRGSYFDRAAVLRYEQFLAASPLVQDWAWVTNRLGTRGEEFSSTYMTNLGHAYSAQVNVYGVSSNFAEVAMSDFLIASQQDGSTALSLSEQLYTVRGSQSAIIGTNAKNFYHLTGIDSDSSFLFSLQRNDPPSLRLARLKPLAFLDLAPRLTFTQFPTMTTQTAMVSLPLFVELCNGSYSSVLDLQYASLIIKQRSSNSDQDVDSLVSSLKDIGASTGGSVYDSRSLGEAVAKSDAVMGLIFNSATDIAMGLCLFSLMASMFTNIYEQSKEIAVVRAMGLSAAAVVRIYTYEAFVLVLAASLLGMCIGALMSWTMSAQRVLFTQLPVTVPFPWQLVILVLIGSFVCAIVSSCLPARRLMQKKIAAIMRTVL